MMAAAAALRLEVATLADPKVEPVDWDAHEEDDMDPETATFEPRFIEVKVGDHETVGSGILQKHTTYRVRTETTFSHYKSRQFEVKRRYREFFLLHQFIQDKFPSIALPELPPSRFAGRFEEKFIAERKRGLEDFINWVAQHPVLREEKFVRVFLEIDKELLNADAGVAMR